MPIYMDRHYVEGATISAAAQAHDKDVAIQEKYPVKFLTYWSDEPRCIVFSRSNRLIRKPSSVRMTRLMVDPKLNHRGRSERGSRISG